MCTTNTFLCARAHIHTQTLTFARVQVINTIYIAIVNSDTRVDCDEKKITIIDIDNIVIIIIVAVAVVRKKANTLQ